MFSLENGKKSAFQCLQIYPVGENSGKLVFLLISEVLNECFLFSDPCYFHPSQTLSFFTTFEAFSIRINVSQLYFSIALS